MSEPPPPGSSLTLCEAMQALMKFERSIKDSEAKVRQETERKTKLQGSMARLVQQIQTVFKVPASDLQRVHDNVATLRAKHSWLDAETLNKMEMLILEDLQKSRGLNTRIQI